MTDLYPKTPKAIRERIRRYERALKKELQTGYGGDGYGKRYLLGPFYMLLGDVDGALASFDWYEKAYPDDVGDPYQYLTWALGLYKGEQKQEAFNKLYSTMLENLYLVPLVLQQTPQPLDIWHGSNLAEMEYAMSIPEELLELWDNEARAEPQTSVLLTRPWLVSGLAGRAGDVTRPGGYRPGRWVSPRLRMCRMFALCTPQCSCEQHGRYIGAL